MWSFKGTQFASSVKTHEHVKTLYNDDGTDEKMFCIAIAMAAFMRNVEKENLWISVLEKFIASSWPYEKHKKIAQ